MSTLEKNAMIVVLNTAQWGASKADKELSDAVTDQYQAKKGTARVRKQLIPKDALKTLSSAIGAAKTIHNAMTLPYGDHGDRLLPIGQFDSYKASMHSAIETVSLCLKDFLEKYESHLAEQSLRDLGQIGKRDDYPTVSELRGKFGVSYEILPVPSAAHFIADVGEEERERIRADLEQRSEAKLNAAMVSVYERIEEELRRLIARLGTDSQGNPNRIHATALETIKTLATAVPNLNITSDPKLNLIATKIRQAIGAIEIDDLRYRSKKPQVIQATTAARTGLSKELTSIAETYFGPEVQTAAIASEETGQ